MKIYEMGEKEELLESITKMIEKDTGKNIFTMRVKEENKNKDELEVVVVFKDEAILFGNITVGYVRGKLACRLRGNWI